jgi:hypothetical protein
VEIWGVALQADGGNEVRVCGLKHQKKKHNMDHFAGLDVSVKETSICIVDDTGKIVREVKVPSEPEALLQVLTNPAFHFKRIGLDQQDGPRPIGSGCRMVLMIVILRHLSEHGQSFEIWKLRHLQSCNDDLHHILF